MSSLQEAGKPAQSLLPCPRAVCRSAASCAATPPSVRPGAGVPTPPGEGPLPSL